MSLPFKDTVYKKDDSVRVVDAVSVASKRVWWYNPHTKKKPKLRQCSQEAWERWVEGAEQIDSKGYLL